MTEYRHRAARYPLALTCSVGLALALTLSACGSDDSGTSEGGAADDAEASLESALEEGGEITVWAWEPTLDQVVEDFEEEYPEVSVDLVNAGSGDDQYTALQNAISAGSGIPDVAHIEYFALAQFVHAEALTDLAQFGAAELEGTYTPGPWSSVSQGEGVYGLPMDSGPMALFYNKEVFDTHDVDVPTTWDEYVDAARELQEADPDVYITSDTGDAGLATSLIWQAGGQPFQVDGTEVTVDFTDEGSTTYAETWQQLIDEDLVAPINGWTDEWYQALSDGTIATLSAGAWMPANFESGVPGASGDWRVAPLPQWEDGESASAENGGSALAVMRDGENANEELAYAFVEYANAGDGVQTKIDQGLFPAVVEKLESDEFLETEFEYFGGQQANKIFAESAANVREGWSYLPFQVYAHSIFNDTVGQAYVSDTTISDGLHEWQEALTTFAADQGFDVSQ
ncbi:sugar ABC transporter substrate-binding protein [Actinobacteria bacterium YIM 96077]|uniref:Sugar ABC transporter substrate-binding protein n=1 Tax=Phytoactinopolyspora halophila TaxID=1981511 RepID=A0A329R029_9ACTN|nr:sugar ABC transporter substrate-binding protein [Phytoactinopolyspora halophila]AYY13157.1 sugar ABC transporter substrate-binding protein [Actinobacteria bacterium YIM 96077]RAW17703.1 sugar ABC transporter substrate-binding protein [Phytoactinopolyspora halophila]